MPTNNILAFFETLYAIKYAFLVKSPLRNSSNPSWTAKNEIRLK